MNQTLTFISTTVGYVIHMLVCALASVSTFITNAWEPTKAYLIYAWHTLSVIGNNVLVFIKTHSASIGA